MTSNLKYTKNYTGLGEAYQLVLPLSLEGLIPEDESVRLLSHELDYTLLYQAYSSKGRNPAVDWETMVKILTYAYSQNIYSSRRIETACHRDINFMWLLAGHKVHMMDDHMCNVSKNFINHRQRSYENIMSETGNMYRMNRSIQAEGIFEVLKKDYEFQRFRLRGKTKVKLEILLLCFGYSINKLHAKIQNDRLGSHMFPLKTA